MPNLECFKASEICILVFFLEILLNMHTLFLGTGRLGHKRKKNKVCPSNWAPFCSLLQFCSFSDDQE